MWKIQWINFSELFDVGGSHGHRNSRHVFYNNYQGIILVHDLSNRKSEQNLERWLREIVQYSNRCEFSSKYYIKTFIEFCFRVYYHRFLIELRSVTSCLFRCKHIYLHANFTRGPIKRKTNHENVFFLGLQLPPKVHHFEEWWRG